MNSDNCPEGLCCGARTRTEDHDPASGARYRGLKDCIGNRSRDNARRFRDKENMGPMDGLDRVLNAMSQIDTRDLVDCKDWSVRNDFQRAVHRLPAYDARTIGPTLGTGGAAHVSPAMARVESTDSDCSLLPERHGRFHGCEPIAGQSVPVSPPVTPLACSTRREDLLAIPMITPVSVDTLALSDEDEGPEVPPLLPVRFGEGIPQSWAARGPVHHVEITTPMSVVTDCPSPAQEGAVVPPPFWAHQANSPDIFREHSSMRPSDSPNFLRERNALRPFDSPSVLREHNALRPSDSPNVLREHNALKPANSPNIMHEHNAMKPQRSAKWL